MIEDKLRLAVTLDDVVRARETLGAAVVNTDFDISRTLSRLFGAELWLKFENLQFTASFKERGALNRLEALTAAERRRGVIAMSAGNHAQGVAYHAARLGIPATIVMPDVTPIVKVENTRQHGAEVILNGPTLESAATFATVYGRDRALTFIHPFDDPLVIAGQGTLGLEMLEAVPTLDLLIVPIGGGGLISGVAVAAKALKPDIEIIGVQPRYVPTMYNAVKGTDLPIRSETVAEGIAVKEPGRLTTPIVKALVDDLILVDEPLLEQAISLYLTIEKTVVEGAGAAGLAAILANPDRFRGRRIGLILCGGNIDTRLLSSILTRELAREGRLSQLSIDIPDQPGQLAKVAVAIGQSGANIVEVYHQRVFTELPAKGAALHLVIETRDRSHLMETIARLRECGYTVAVKSAGRNGSPAK